MAYSKHTTKPSFTVTKKKKGGGWTIWGKRNIINGVGSVSYLSTRGYMTWENLFDVAGFQFISREEWTVISYLTYLPLFYE